MYQNPLTKKQHLAHLASVEALKKSLKKMHSLQVFSIENLRKKMRPWFRTFSLGKSNTHLSLHLKNTKLGITCYLIEQKDNLYCFELKSTKYGEHFPFTIWVRNDKEFLEKIILDYNLFNVN